MMRSKRKSLRRQAYVDQLISIATSPLTAAGQQIAATRLLEKTLKDMEQEQAQEEPEEGEGNVLVINI